MSVSFRSTSRVIALLLICSIELAACGGGGGSSSSSSSSSSVASSSSSSLSSSSSSSSTSSALSVQQRTQAATQTAQNNALCTPIQPFYWEIGDRTVMLAGATAGTGTTPNATTSMLIASASKLVFGAFVVQLHNGNLTANDIAALNMTAGYTNFTYGSCLRLLRTNQDAETVHECFTSASNNGSGTNGDQDPNSIGKFFYNGGHFQWLTDTDLNLGTANNATLSSAVAAQLPGFSFSYDSPQLAAGVQTTAQDYGFFLRQILDNQLLIHDVLGTHPVCTNPLTCPTALSTPIPTSESWHYSLGHWVEDDPTVGDGAFSSPGAFGFYPWIDASKTYYGVLARYSTPLSSGDSVAVDSVKCGRTIRKAWMTGVEQ